MARSTGTPSPIASRLASPPSTRVNGVRRPAASQISRVIVVPETCGARADAARCEKATRPRPDGNVRSTHSPEPPPNSGAPAAHITQRATPFRIEPAAPDEHAARARAALCVAEMSQSSVASRGELRYAARVSLETPLAPVLPLRIAAAVARFDSEQVGWRLLEPNGDAPRSHAARIVF